jgi:hypothetical protein
MSLRGWKMGFAERACQALCYGVLGRAGKAVDTYVLPVQIESARYAVGPAFLAAYRFPAPSALV